MDEYWKSKEGIERREKQSGDEWLNKCRAGGFQDGEKISAGASRRSGAHVYVFTCDVA